MLYKNVQINLQILENKWKIVLCIILAKIGIELAALNHLTQSGGFAEAIGYFRFFLKS